MPKGTNFDRGLLAFALVSVGVLWLLVQIGFVPPALLSVAASWWPALLIGAGLDLIAPRFRPAKIPFTALACLLVVGLALFGVSRSAMADTTVTLDRDTATDSVAVTLVLSSSPTTIGAAQPTSLFSAHFAGQPQGEVRNSSGALSSINVRPLPSTALSFLSRGRWDFGLPTWLPVSLMVDARSGSSTIDLSSIALVDLEIEAGSGDITANLPGVGAVYRAAVSGGSGHVDLRIAPGASVDLEARIRSGGAELFVGEGTDMRFVLRAGSGDVTLDLPDTAPVRLTIEDDGSGRLVLPTFLEKRSGSGDRGVWESRNLAQGGRVIDVVIKQAGSGEITVR